MAISERFLIVGGSSGIGLALSDEIAAQGVSVSCTNREQKGEGFLLDLADVPEDLGFLSGFSCAFICAARAGFAECEEDPVSTFQVNVEGMLAVVKALIENGCFVVFLSTSAVFDGNTPWPNEDSVCQPTTEYGRQKAIAEECLLGLDKGAGQVAIVRLTKVLSGDAPIIERFGKQIQNGLPFDAFCDMSISPISMPYVVESLLIIAAKKIGGIYHLSGAAEMTYAELAQELAQLFKADPSIVRGVSSSESQIYFRPKYPALGMVRVSEMHGLDPESIAVMFENLLTVKKAVS